MYLVTLAVIYYIPKRVIKRIRDKGILTIIKTELLKPESAVKKSASIGFGFFMGIAPVWGFQLLIGI